MGIKTAFSTLGCPEWNLSEILTMAKDLSFQGIEIRGLGTEIRAAKAAPFTSGRISDTLQSFDKFGLKISCFSSSCLLKDTQHVQSVLAEGYEYIELAARSGAKYVRLLADREPAPQEEADDNAVISKLDLLAPYAQYKGVTLLLETNGVYADSLRLKRLLDQVSHPSVSVLWDIHHPYRYFHESPETTYGNLKNYIKYVHVKDSVMENGKVKYRMPGMGDVPVKESLEILKKNSFDGWVCLEWVKRWANDIDDPAVVFPQFIHFMEPFIASSVTPDVHHTGIKEKNTVFDKETMVDLTFGQLLEKIAEDFPDQYAFRYTTRNYTRTYREFLEEVDSCARAFLALGVKKGDHVAIWATNYPQWFLTFWAATRIGAVLVTVNTSYKIHEAEYLLRQADIHTLVMIDGYKDSNYVEIINEICPELRTSEKGKLNARRLPFLRNVITVDSMQPGCYLWDDLAGLGSGISQQEIINIQSTLHKDDVCNMQYTSGTTGFPKGVMLTHYNVINNGKSIGDCMAFTTNDRLLIQVPMFHCFGMVLAMTAAMTHATTMVPIEYFSPKTALAAIQKEKITAMHGVPTMFIALLEHKDFKNTDFSHMRTGIMAGSPCPVPVMQDVVDKMNMSDITIVFGQTESSPGCTQSRVGDPLEVRVATVGGPLPGVECKIVDPETNQELPDGTPGEFVARGYNIMKGYYKMPEATAAAIDEDGWLHTGDLSIRTPEGNFKITGRIKDMIIRGGENIYPKEIEEFLYSHSNVKDVQVIGVPDATYGEEIMACVIMKPDSTTTEEELKEYVRSHMAKHKTPKYVKFVDEFPMNAAGKIMKYKMREWAVQVLGLEAADSIDTA